MEPHNNQVPDIAMGNIIRELLIDVSKVDYTDEFGFFIRTGDGSEQSGDGDIEYCPVGNKTDAQSITKTVTGSAYFIDPVRCRKIISAGTTATPVYIGYGV